MTRPQQIRRKFEQQGIMEEFHHKQACLFSNIHNVGMYNRKEVNVTGSAKLQHLQHSIRSGDAYGNVGYSLGYSCERLLKPDAACKAVSYGFVGRWTDEGKLIIIFVMFLGRFKKFSLKGGKP
ncbi:hypothetical protein ACP70R_010991 [Stipagrostis hirtigluma subsp. patula]